jgi:fatty-acyl-CoA synthase
MAALTIDGAPDLAGIARAARALPRYARPVFLRITPAIEATATFKPVKRVLAAEGFDPAKVADPLYVFDAEREAYVAINAERYAAIASGDARL